MRLAVCLHGLQHGTGYPPGQRQAEATGVAQVQRAAPTVCMERLLWTKLVGVYKLRLPACFSKGPTPLRGAKRVHQPAVLLWWGSAKIWETSAALQARRPLGEFLAVQLQRTSPVASLLGMGQHAAAAAGSDSSKVALC